MIFLLCIALILAAPVLHVILGTLRITGRIKLSLILIALICLLVGIAFTVLATYIDIVNLPDNIKCATPSIGLIFLGFGVTAITIPVIGIILFTINYYRNKRVVVTQTAH